MSKCSLNGKMAYSTKNIIYGNTMQFWPLLTSWFLSHHQRLPAFCHLAPTPSQDSWLPDLFQPPNYCLTPLMKRGAHSNINSGGTCTAMTWWSPKAFYNTKRFYHVEKACVYTFYLSAPPPSRIIYINCLLQVHNI